VDPHTATRFAIEQVIEASFFVHMIFQFFVEYKPLGEKYPIRDISLICNNYCKGRLPLDVITLLPLQYLELKRRRQHIFYAIKMLRIIRGFHLFDINNMMTSIKEYY
jgi:hypothetical protein